MTRVLITREDIRRGLLLGRALLVLYRIMLHRMGLKEIVVTTEFGWRAEEDFDTYKVSETESIGPQIMRSSPWD